jgi:hypothetical protein
VDLGGALANALIMFPEAVRLAAVDDFADGLAGSAGLTLDPK